MTEEVENEALFSEENTDEVDIESSNSEENTEKVDNESSYPEENTEKVDNGAESNLFSLIYDLIISGADEIFSAIACALSSG